MQVFKVFLNRRKTCMHIRKSGPRRSRSFILPWYASHQEGYLIEQQTREIKGTQGITYTDKRNISFMYFLQVCILLECQATNTLLQLSLLFVSFLRQDDIPTTSTSTGQNSISTSGIVCQILQVLLQRFINQVGKIRAIFFRGRCPILFGGIWTQPCQECMSQRTRCTWQMLGII